MLIFLWSWLLVGLGAALYHWYRTAEAELFGDIDAKEAQLMYMLTALMFVAGPLSVAYILYVEYVEEEDDESDE